MLNSPAILVIRFLLFNDLSSIFQDRFWIVMPNSSATFYWWRFSWLKISTGVSAGFDLSRSSQPFYQLLLKIMLVDNDWTKTTSFYHSCRTWEDWFLAVCLLRLQLEGWSSDGVVNWNPDGIHFPVITDTVEAISFVKVLNKEPPWNLLFQPIL